VPQLPPQPSSPQDLETQSTWHGAVHVPAVQVSPTSQTAMPHNIGQAPQSPWQLAHDSPASQVPSPQSARSQKPQSPGQPWQVSPAPHEPSPQAAVGHVPQSFEQVAHSSSPSQAPLPQ